MFAGRIVALAKAARPLIVRATKATPAFPKVVASFSGVRFNSTLAETLQKELKHEQGEQEVDQEFVDIKKLVLKAFKLHDHTGEGVVKLTREHHGEHIEVVFDCQDIEENEVEAETEEAEEADVDVGVNFEVIISKPSAHSKLVIQCLGTAEGTTIRNVRHQGADKATDDLDGYSGPTFDDLDGALQDEIAKYLEDRHIDSDFGYFVLAYATDKEQREYVNWLNKVHDFVLAK